MPSRSRRETPHRERDVLALMAGLLFVAIAVLFLLASTTPLSLSGPWLLPVVLLGIGGAGLLVNLRPDPESVDDVGDLGDDQDAWRSSNTS